MIEPLIEPSQRLNRVLLDPKLNLNRALIQAHRRSIGLVSEWFKGSWNGFSFYSNCEIARVDFWTQPMVKDYLQRIDEAGGIYKVLSLYHLCGAIYLNLRIWFMCFLLNLCIL